MKVGFFNIPFCGEGENKIPPWLEVSVSEDESLMFGVELQMLLFCSRYRLHFLDVVKKLRFSFLFFVLVFSIVEDM